MTATKRRRLPHSIPASDDHPQGGGAGAHVAEAEAIEAGVDFATLLDASTDGDISGIAFDDLVDATSNEVVDALVMVATVATQGRNPERAAFLLRQAARRLLACPMEYLVIDALDDVDSRPAV